MYGTSTMNGQVVARLVHRSSDYGVVQLERDKADVYGQAYEKDDVVNETESNEDLMAECRKRDIFLVRYMSLTSCQTSMMDR